MKLSTKQIATTSVMLAVCIASQFFKNMNVYITGTIINVCLMLTTLITGIFCGIILSVITPVTSFLITGNPLISAIPLIIFMIMIGNILLVVVVELFKNIFKFKIYIPMIIASIVKAIFMGTTISAILIPNFIPEKMIPRMAIFQWIFSGVQLITALIATVIATIIWTLLRKE